MVCQYVLYSIANFALLGIIEDTPTPYFCMTSKPNTLKYSRISGYETTSEGNNLIAATVIGNSDMLATALEKNVGARECSTAWVEAFKSQRTTISDMLRDCTHPVWVLDALLYKDRFLFDPTAEKNITQVNFEQHSQHVIDDIHSSTDCLGVLASAVISQNTHAIEQILQNQPFAPSEIDVCARLDLECGGAAVDCFSQHAHFYTDRSIAMMAWKCPTQLPQHTFNPIQLARAVLQCLSWNDKMSVVHLLQFDVSEGSVKAQTKTWNAYKHMWDECVNERLRATLHTVVGDTHGAKHKKM